MPPRPLPPALRLTVAKPCSEDWDAMGEGAVRRCEKCRTDVHDLGALGPEAAAAVVERGGCVRYRQRPDGSVHFPRVAALALALAACAPHPAPVAAGAAPSVGSAASPRCVPPAPGPTVDVPAGELHLLVIDDAGLPIPGVLVNLGAAGQPSGQVVTDEEGVAVVTGLVAGEWRWVAQRPGFSLQEGRATLTAAGGVALTVGLIPRDALIVMGMVVVRSPVVDPETIPAGITLPSSTLDRLPR